jgi:O-antigen/teichoic acid export membrane protein
MSEPTVPLPSDPPKAGAAPEIETTVDEEGVLAERLEIDGRIDLPPGRTLRAHAARGVIINSAFQVLITGMGLVRRVGVAVFLTQTQYGIWGLIVSTLLTLSWLKQVGVNDKYVQQDEPDQEAAFQKAFTLELGYSTLFYVAVVAVLPLYALLYGHSEIIAPGAVTALVLPLSAFETPIWVWYRRMRFVRQRSLEAIDPVVALTVTMALGASGFGYWSIVIGSVAGTLSGGIGAVVTSPYPLRLRYDRGTLREYFHFSWPLFVAGASSMVAIQGTVIVGNAAIGLAGVGALGLASSFMLFADRVDTVIRLAIYPAVCAVRERREVLKEAFVKSNRLAVMWGLTFGVGIALFAPDLVTYVLGDRWRPAEGLLQAIGLIVGLRQIAFNWTVFVRAIGNTRPIAVNSVLILVSSVVFTLPLMALYGLMGYAAGLAATLLIDLISRGYYMSRLFPGFDMVRHAVIAIAPSIPPALAVLAFRALSDLPDTAGLALLELAGYLILSGITTYLFERPLLREVVGYLRGSRASLATA